MDKFLINVDNAFYRTSWLWALVIGWNGVSWAEKGNMWMVAFDVALAGYYAYKATQASREIALNNERMDRLTAKPVEIKAEDISCYSLTGYWATLENHYPDKSRLEILRYREEEITTVIQEVCIEHQEDTDENFKINVFTPLGQNEQLRTEVVPKTDWARKVLLELSQKMADMKVKSKVEVEE
jgi:hypothetical protein